jgi:hypothetical protein
MAISSQGTTFTFPGFTAHYTSISVEEPEAEVVDMTTIDDPLGRRRMIPTGDVTAPATIRVDYIRLPTTTAKPLGFTGKLGLNGGQTVVLSFAHATAGNFTAKAAVVSASTEIAVGDIIRGTLNFVVDSST